MYCQILSTLKLTQEVTQLASKPIRHGVRKHVRAKVGAIISQINNFVVFMMWFSVGFGMWQLDTIRLDLKPWNGIVVLVVNIKRDIYVFLVFHQILKAQKPKNHFFGSSRPAFDLKSKFLAHFICNSLRLNFFVFWIFFSHELYVHPWPFCIL